MKIALLQINPTVGDLAGNARLILDALRARVRAGADLAATPELALVGYLPRDLLLSAGFVARSWDALERAGARRRRRCRRCSSACRSPTRRTKGGRCSTARCCCAAAASSSAFARRCCRPTTSSTRTATSSRSTARSCSTSPARRLGISICEDIWNDRDFWKRRRYHHDPIEELVARRRRRDRQHVGVAVHRRQARASRGDARQHGAKHRLPIAYVNQFGGNDDLVFDGRSTMFDADGAPSRAAARSTPTWSSATSTRRSRSRPPPISALESEIWRALVLGTRDYVRKCGFSSVVLGLSGGIDSALTAAIAAEALGAGPRARRADAVAVSRAAAASTMRMRWPRTSASKR